MKEADKYYLKTGKLELFLLDEDDEYQKEDEVNPKDLLKDIELEQTSQLKDKRKLSAQPKLNVSKEVYNTLHTMGQFLTKQEESTHSGKRSSISNKEKKLNEIVSSIKVQKFEIPPVSVKHREEQSEVNTTQVVSVGCNVHRENADVGEPQGNSLEDEASQCKSAYEELSSGIEALSTKKKYRPLLEEEELGLTQSKESFLEQESIDDIVELFFKGKTYPYAYARELKRHIDKKINSIRNYRE